MERIKVSDEWRLLKADTTFEMEFSKPIDKSIALKAMKDAIKAINYEDGYADLWLQDLADCKKENGFDILSALYGDEFYQYIPAMCKAVAEALPEIGFCGYACNDSLKCYSVDEFEFSYDGKKLSLKETYADDDCGFFCPDCGMWILPAHALRSYEDDDEIDCDDCDKVFKFSELKYVPPTINNLEFCIR